MNPGRLITPFAQLARDLARDGNKCIGLLAAVTDFPSEVAPGLPGQVAGSPGAFWPEHDRKTLPLTGLHCDIGVVLEHRDIGQVDWMCGEPPRQVPHVKPCSHEPQSGGRQPDDCQPAATASAGAGDGLLLVPGQILHAGCPGSEHRYLGSLASEGLGQVAENFLGPTDQRGISPGHQSQFQGGLQESCSCVSRTTSCSFSTPT